mmetsp:Transcript_63468/g.163336  ORF Transcript_63468/g.163336 Transcript_63468/m.163336 type:complete len:266 (+) Transcript_63468:246-1043(+)
MACAKWPKLRDHQHLVRIVEALSGISRAYRDGEVRTLLDRPVADHANRIPHARYGGWPHPRDEVLIPHPKCLVDDVGEPSVLPGRIWTVRIVLRVIIALAVAVPGSFHVVARQGLVEGHILAVDLKLVRVVEKAHGLHPARDNVLAAWRQPCRFLRALGLTLRLGHLLAHQLPRKLRLEVRVVVLVVGADRVVDQDRRIHVPRHLHVDPARLLPSALLVELLLIMRAHRRLAVDPLILRLARVLNPHLGRLRGVPETNTGDDARD